MVALQDFYDFAGLGVIRSKGARRRVFFLAGRMWATMEGELFKQFSTGAAVILSGMGRTYGVNLAKEAKMTDPTPSRVMEVLKTLAAVSGWGEISLGGDWKAGRKFQVSVKNCILCSESEKRSSPSCHLLVAICLGAADEAFGIKHTAVETKCIRTGADLCVISIDS